jgi:hypothetical protein
MGLFKRKTLPPAAGQQMVAGAVLPPRPPAPPAPPVISVPCPDCKGLRIELETVTADRDQAWQQLSEIRTPKPKINKLQRELDACFDEITDLKAHNKDLEAQLAALRGR